MRERSVKNRLRISSRKKRRKSERRRKRRRREREERERERGRERERKGKREREREKGKERKRKRENFPSSHACSECCCFDGCVEAKAPTLPILPFLLFSLLLFECGIHPVADISNLNHKNHSYFLLWLSNTHTHTKFDPQREKIPLVEDEELSRNH
jgi:hypothetical protein